MWFGKGCQELRDSPFLFPYREHDLSDLKRRLAAVAPGVEPTAEATAAAQDEYRLLHRALRELGGP